MPKENCNHNDSTPCGAGKTIAGLVLGAFSQSSSTDQIERTDGHTMTRFLDAAGEVFEHGQRKGTMTIGLTLGSKAIPLPTMPESGLENRLAVLRRSLMSVTACASTGNTSLPQWHLAC